MDYIDGFPWALLVVLLVLATIVGTLRYRYQIKPDLTDTDTDQATVIPSSLRDLS